MYNFDVNSTNNFFIFFSLLCTRQHSIIEHDFSSRAKPSSPFYPFLLDSNEFAGWGAEKRGKLRFEGSDVRGWNRVAVSSCFAAAFRTILAGASSRRKKRGGQRRNGRSVAARRRETEKTHVFRAYVSWRCLPATSRSLRPRRHVLDFFARNSNRVLMQRRGNKNSIFLG